MIGLSIADMYFLVGACAFVVIFYLIIFLFFRQPKFGAAPAGKRLQRIFRSRQYCNGEFQNAQPTPMLTKGVNYASVTWEFFFKRSKDSIPKDPLPAKRTDLKAFTGKENAAIWFGHSSYLLLLDGLKILADPVFSGHASPLSFTTKSFRGTDIYRPGDFPELDLLVITHDHWDHLDYQTVLSLKHLAKHTVTSLGVGAHLHRWGFPDAGFTELDWRETYEGPGVKLTALPARHFSGRTFTRNKTLWSSFVLQTNAHKIYIGGDSGYGTHFRDIGDVHGPFDLALLECGQYNQHWKYIHMLPEEVPLAARDLKASHFMPVHWAKFALSLHSWYEPIQRVTAAAADMNEKILTPEIGQVVYLDKENEFKKWWP